MIPSQHIFERIIVDQSKNRLMDNSWRGVFAEYLIADILGDGWHVKDGNWNAWDIDGPNAEKIEVKSSAFIQPWCKNNMPKGEYRISRPDFDIAAKFPDNTKQEERIKTRPADIYIFALHAERDYKNADHRVSGQWKFYVVSKDSLPKGQGRIGLNPLRKIVTSVRDNELQNKVESPCKHG